MVFSDFREYVPGDDVRSISWTLTAKMSKPFIKTFEEDRETQIILVVDASSSLDFGTGKMAKKEIIQMLTSLLAFCAQKNQDHVGLLLFSDDVDLYVPPKKGLHHVFRIIREVCCPREKPSGTHINTALHFLQKVLKKPTHIFLFSDFLFANPFEQDLKQLGNRHDIISVILSDPLESKLASLGLVDVEDLETGEIKTLDLSSQFLIKDYQKDLDQKIKKRDQALRRSQSDLIFVNTQKDIYDPFVQFFSKRMQKHKSPVKAR